MNSIATIPGRRGLSPLSIGLIISGFLFFMIVVIVRNVTAPTPQISAATAAGVAAVQVPQLQQNVFGALPAFSAQPQTQPVPQALPVLPAVVLQSPAEVAAFDNPTWLSVAYGPDNHDKHVWGEAWFGCRHIDPAALTYASVRSDPALQIWGGLAPARQNDIAKECAKP